MKRIVAFVLLLGCGLAALKFAIGDEVAVQTTDPRAKRPTQDRPEGPGGVRVDSGSINTTVSQSGRLVFPRRRDVDMGDGRIRKETVFVLRAEDSAPIGDGLQQLTDVTLEVYDDDAPAATVTASRAFLELGRDANGQPRFDEQKEVDLRDAVVVSLPGSRLAGMRLELGDAKVKVGEEQIELTTAPDQAVRFTLQGRRTATLTGAGARARLPRDKRAGMQRATVTILSNPRLETDDLNVRAAGRMRYVENMASGAARITLEEDVELDLSRGRLAMPGTEGEGASAVRGDQFTGWLLRAREPAADVPASKARSGDMVWQRLALQGAPASVDMPGVKVETPRITVRPGPFGDPYVVTAHGGGSRVEQTELRAGSRQADVVTGYSPRRIHLMRPGDVVGALHRAMGFPRWTTRPIDRQQVVRFVGSSRLESGARQLTASEGMVVARRSGRETGVVRAMGDVDVVQKPREDDPSTPALRATGNDGLQLIVTSEQERLRVGPSRDDGAARWRDHRYSVQQGDARLNGVGTCEVVRTGDRSEIALSAPFDEIEADFGQDGTELRGVRQLRAQLSGREVTALDVGGLPVRGELVQDGQRVRVQAPRLRQIGPRSLQLLPMAVDEAPWNELQGIDRLPRLRRSWGGDDDEARRYEVDVFSPRIDLHEVGGRAALVDAHADDDQPARIYAKLPQTGSSEPATVSCEAGRLRLLPYAVAPVAAAAHFGGGGPLRAIAGHAIARPWLLVDDVRGFELDDEQQGHIEGTGKTLLISQGGGAALFVGDPDAQAPAVVTRLHEGREVVVRGARVRVRTGEDVRLSALGTFDGRSTLLAPTMTLHEPGERGLLSHMQAMCRGDIHVEPRAVRFSGPVEAFSLRPDGQPDPEGLHIDARELIMQRQESTGRVSVIEGDDVVVDWTRIDARAASVELDLLRETCVASDPKAATISTPDGRELRSPRISVNYVTWEVSMGPGSARQAAKSVDGDVER